MSVAAENFGGWTVEDVLALPDDGRRTRHELIDGAVLMTPAPGVPHQRASYRLAKLLEQAGETVGASIEVLEGVNLLVPAGLAIPDIVAVDLAMSRSAEVTLAAAGVLAVVEIISPSTGRVDRMVKPSVYAEAGIPSYWRVELEPSPTVFAFSLKGGQYQEACRASAGTPTTVPIPYPVRIDPGALKS